MKNIGAELRTSLQRALSKTSAEKVEVEILAKIASAFAEKGKAELGELTDAKGDDVKDSDCVRRPRVQQLLLTDVVAVSRFPRGHAVDPTSSSAADLRFPQVDGLMTRQSWWNEVAAEAQVTPSFSPHLLTELVRESL